jgi:type VI secretion system protein ImpA
MWKIKARREQVKKIMAMFANFDSPVSAENFCGPDPDLDPQVQNFLAVAEGQLPASYRDFDRKSFDARPTLQKLEELLQKSRDVRFVVLAAKYFILSDNLNGFVESIQAAATLLKTQWEHCHPTEDSGGIQLRSAYLKSLDDLPTSVLPLQNALLINDRRVGAISIRAILISEKKLPARAEEPVLDADSIREAFLRVEPIAELLKLQTQMSSVVSNLQDMRQLFVDKVGYDVAPQFEQLPALVKSISEYLTLIVGQRAPQQQSQGISEGEAASDQTNAVSDRTASENDTVASPDVGSVKEASNALEAVLTYYASREPSSPSRLLVKQAHLLVGKSFVEAMRMLAPSMAEETKIKIGGDAPFSLDFGQLSSLFPEESQLGDEVFDAKSYSAATRADATALMRKVEQFYKLTEPSSPIPLLVERARNFVAKDFTSLLREMAKKDENS